ncbi:MAG: undecaprenyldiphospho-muramoylpentapeptide beta-N-acetylglucosaminyltransferase [Candidatus Omnitrophota bacterium]
MTKILISAGSSGGHIYPAIATAFELRKKGPSSRILFVGTRHDLDEKIFKSEGYDFEIIPARRFRLNRIRDDFKRAGDLLRRFRPDVAIGFGGYISFLILCAARAQGIPFLIHEQNMVPGMANRILALFATRTAVSFDRTERCMPGKKNISVIGNPLRAELIKVDRHKALNKLELSGDRFTIFAMGGSQGANFINKALIGFAQHLNRAQKKKIQIIHLSGQNDFDLVRSEYEKLGITNRVHPFFEHIWWFYSASDLVISRAGATSIAEICYFEKPSILIPYPKRSIHQSDNAAFMAANGASIVIQEKGFSDKDFRQKVLGLIEDKNSLAKMADSSRKLCRPEAAGTLAEEILSVAKK